MAMAPLKYDGDFMGRWFTALLAVVLLGVLLISGCTEPLDGDTKLAMKSAGEWLGGEQGSSYFPGGAAGEPMGVWRDGNVLYWIIPIKNSNGLYMGNLVSDKANFTSAKQIVTYREPRDRILNYTRSEAYQQMIAESGYPAYKISRPVLLSTPGGGLSWYSEVKENSEVIDELYIRTFTLS